MSILDVSRQNYAAGLQLRFLELLTDYELAIEAFERERQIGKLGPEEMMRCGKLVMDRQKQLCEFFAAHVPAAQIPDERARPGEGGRAPGNVAVDGPTA